MHNTNTESGLIMPARRRPPLVTVRTELLAHAIESAAADLRRGGQAVSYRTLARYLDMPEYLLRRVVELQSDGSMT